jgi:hypothetical protein
MEKTLRLLYKDLSVKFLGTLAVHSEDHTKYTNTLSVGKCRTFNPLTPELNPSTQRCLPRFFLLGILIFKGLTVRRLYKSFCVKGLIITVGGTYCHRRVLNCW